MSGSSLDIVTAPGERVERGEGVGEKDGREEGGREGESVREIHVKGECCGW